MKKYLLGPSAVRKIDAVIRGKGEVSSSPLAGAGVTDERGFEAPYTIRWAQSENSGSGAWLIWLPSETLLMVGSAAVDPSAELTAAQDYPDGWYVLDFLSSSSGGDIYLNVHQPKEGDPTANFADEPDTPEDDETVTPILVATTSVDSSTGERQVKQFVFSTITIGGNGETVPIPWDLKVKDGDLYVFSPIAYVLTANGQTKLQQELIVNGATKGEWFKITQLASPVCCIIYASVSGSGSVTYSVGTGGRPFGSVVLFKQIIGTYARSVSSGPIDSVTQFRRGAPTINGLGIADAASIFLNDNGETEIKGFKSQAAETTKLSQHLQAQTEFAGQVLVRTEVNGVKQLVFVPIGNGIGGGGGETTGYSGPVNVPTGELRCNSASGYYIQSAYNVWTFENGLLKSIDTTTRWMQGGLQTTPLSGEYS